MARRRNVRHASKHHRSRRRRMGAVGGDALMQIIAGGILGAVGGQMLSLQAAKMAPSVNPDTLVYGLIGGETLGGYLLAKKSTNPLMKGIGLGLAIAGGVKLVAKVAPKMGILGARPVLIPRRGSDLVGGVYDVPRLGATPNGGFPRPSTVGNVNGHGVDMAAAAAAAGVF